MVIGLNTMLISCTTDSVAEDEGLYNIYATEGDDGDPPLPPPGG